MKEKTERKGFYVRLNDEEVNIVADLKTKHAVNISQMFKNCIRDLHHNLQAEKEAEK